MDALTIILTSAPARFAALVSASGIGIAPAPLGSGVPTWSRGAAARGLARGEVVPFVAPRTGARAALRC